MKNKLLSFIFALGSYSAYSQVGIGIKTPSTSSQLEVYASDMGILIPRINLSSSTDAVTIKNGNINSLLVFNTANASDIAPGYYYWYDDKWNRIVISSDLMPSPGTVIYDPATEEFSYVVNNSGTTQTIDFSQIIKANETVTTQLQDVTTGAITYTNEAGLPATSQVVSTNADNLIKVGTDGGSLLTPTAIKNATTVENTSAGNSLTTTVNDVTSTGAPIINENVLNISGNNLTSTINGIASNAIDLTATIAAGETTTNLAQNTTTGIITYTNEDESNQTANVRSTDTGNILSIGTDGGTFIDNSTIKANETVTTITPFVTTGQTIATYENEAGGTPADIKETITTQLQDVTTGAITYTNEAGLPVTSQVVSTNADNLIKVGTDGGSLLTPSAIKNATTVENTSTGNTATITVNDVTSTGAPIINENVLNISGNNLTSTINGIASNAIDLTSTIVAGQTTTNLTQSTATGIITYTNEDESNQTAIVRSADTGNILSIGSDGGTFIDNSTIKANETVTTQLQDVTTGAITYTNETGSQATSQVVSANADNLIKVGTDGGSLLTPTAIKNATTVENISAGNSLTTTVNDVTSTGAPIINENVLNISGNNLTSTINGIASNTIDLTATIAAAETTTNLTQSAATGIITYTNEDKAVQTANLRSADEGNILTIGTDGGTFINNTAIKSNETITTITPIVTTGNTIATYANETSEAPIDINETITSLKDVVTQGTDQWGQIIDVHTLTYTDEKSTPNPIDLSLLVKGVETLTSLVYNGENHSLIYTDENETSTEFKMVDLIKGSETLTKLEVNPTTGTLNYTDEDEIVTSLDISEAVKEPWFSTTTQTGATSNTEDIYTNGWVGIGYTTPSGASNEKLRVNGSISTLNTYYADYVFEDYFNGFSKIKQDYKFKTLSEIENYIKENKHLPGITPINKLEKTKEGYSFNMSELSIQLLEKTEEIYLHIIEQNNEIEAKDKEIKELKEASKSMNLRLEKLEKLILEKN